MSPEQALAQPISEQTDLYSLGITLMELTTGFVPYPGENPTQIAIKHASPEPVPMPGWLAERPLGSVIAKAVEKKPSSRYASAEAMLEAVKALGLPEPKVSYAPPPKSRDKTIDLPPTVDSGPGLSTPKVGTQLNREISAADTPERLAARKVSDEKHEKPKSRAPAATMVFGLLAAALAFALSIDREPDTSEASPVPEEPAIAPVQTPDSPQPTADLGVERVEASEQAAVLGHATAAGAALAARDAAAAVVETLVTNVAEREPDPPERRETRRESSERNHPVEREEQDQPPDETESETLTGSTEDAESPDPSELPSGRGTPTMF